MFSQIVSDNSVGNFRWTAFSTFTFHLKSHNSKILYQSIQKRPKLPKSSLLSFLYLSLHINPSFMIILILCFVRSKKFLYWGLYISSPKSSYIRNGRKYLHFVIFRSFFFDSARDLTIPFIDFLSDEETEDFMYCWEF